MRSTFPSASYPACGDDRMYDLHHGLLDNSQAAHVANSVSSPIHFDLHGHSLGTISFAAVLGRSAYSDLLGKNGGAVRNRTGDGGFADLMGL